MPELWLSCNLILLSHTIFGKQEYCSKPEQIQHNPTLGTWIITFSLAQSPPNIFVFSVLHFSTYALPDITPNLSDLIYFLLPKKLRNYSLSNSIVCAQQGATPNLQNQAQPALITATKTTSTSEWCFPRDGNQSWTQLQEKGDPVQSILLLSLHFQQLCACCSICDPVGGESSAPWAWLGQLLLSWRLEMLHPCSVFHGTWLVKSSRLGSACPRQQREPGTLPLECISHCCARRGLDIYHSQDTYLYTFLNMFI